MPLDAYPHLHLHTPTHLSFWLCPCACVPVSVPGYDEERRSKFSGMSVESSDLTDEVLDTHETEIASLQKR